MQEGLVFRSKGSIGVVVKFMARQFRLKSESNP